MRDDLHRSAAGRAVLDIEPGHPLQALHPGHCGAAIGHVAEGAAALRRCLPEVPLHYAMEELRGYGFHSGAVFAAFVPGERRQVAHGGRHDHIAEVFARARPAAGFSADLKNLFRVGKFSTPASPGRGWASASPAR
jgi:ATP phosphoribosyltransferase regulatory subunit